VNGNQDALEQWFLTWGKFTPEVTFIFQGGKFTESKIATNANFYISFWTVRVL